MGDVNAARAKLGLSAEQFKELRSFLERDRLYAAYAICDLEEREFGRTRWGMASEGDSPRGSWLV